MPSTRLLYLLTVVVILVVAPAVSAVAAPAPGSASVAPTGTSACVAGSATATTSSDAGNLSVETLVAPGDDYDRLTNASALAAANRTGRLTPASVGVDRTWEDKVVAYGDVVVHRVALNGSAIRLLDVLTAEERESPTANFRAFVTSEAAEFRYVGATACPPELALNASLDRGAIRAVPDRQNDTLSLVLDVDRLLFHPLGGDEPTTDTFVKGHNGLALTLHASSGLVAENVTVGSDYEVEDAGVEFGGRHDGLVELDSANNQSVLGRTLLAPGSDVEVVLRPYTANGSTVVTTATVNRTREFAARVDLSAADGGATYAVAVPELTESPAIRGGAPLVTVGNATTALLSVENQTSTGRVLYRTSVTTTHGGFVAVRNASGGLVGVSDYVEPGATVVQPDLSPGLDANATVTVTAYRDSNGNRAFDDADAPYRANGTVVRDTAVVSLERDDEGPDDEGPSETTTTDGTTSQSTTTPTADSTTTATTSPAPDGSSFPTTPDTGTSSVTDDRGEGESTESTADTSTGGVLGFGFAAGAFAVVLVLLRRRTS